MALSKGVNWEEVRKQYTSSDVTLKDLGEQHGVHLTTIQKRAQKEGWVRGVGEDEKATELAAIAPELGYICSDNAKIILTRVANGWSPKQAFASVGFKDKSAIERWLKQDLAFADLLLAARATALGYAEAALYNSAVTKGSPDAALKILMNANETKEEYTTSTGNSKVSIVVNIGAAEWNRDMQPVTIENGE